MSTIVHRGSRPVGAPVGGIHPTMDYSRTIVSPSSTRSSRCPAGTSKSTSVVVVEFGGGTGSGPPRPREPGAAVAVELVAVGVVSDHPPERAGLLVGTRRLPRPVAVVGDGDGDPADVGDVGFDLGRARAAVLTGGGDLPTGRCGPGLPDLASLRRSGTAAAAEGDGHGD